MLRKNMKLIKHNKINKYRIKIKNVKIHKHSKKNFKKQKSIFKKIILILIFLFSYYYFMEYNLKQILIEVDISRANFHGHGPIQLQKAISKVLPYETRHCKFIPANGIYITNLPKKINYFYLSYPQISEKDFNESLINNMAKNLLLGPSFAPSNMKKFPNHRLWPERRFREVLESIKAFVVHSIRIRDFMASKSNNNDLINKFIILRPCTYVMPKDIKPFNERNIDIILFEKYADSYHGNQGVQLFNLLKSTNKTIQIIRYGYFRKNHLLSLANNSKFVIYFSFYDTGAIALKEIQNYGVITFSHQKEFVISNDTSYYIPELEDSDITMAFKKIMNIINDIISRNNPDSKEIAFINQNINKCERSLDDICDGIRKQ